MYKELLKNRNFIFANEQRLWLVYILAFLLQSLNDIDVSSETAILPEVAVILVILCALQLKSKTNSIVEIT